MHLAGGHPQRPLGLYLNVNPDLATQRQRQVLTLMVEHQYLTADQASAIQPAADGALVKQGQFYEKEKDREEGIGCGKI